MRIFNAIWFLDTPKYQKISDKNRFLWIELTFCKKNEIFSKIDPKTKFPQKLKLAAKMKFPQKCKLAQNSKFHEKSKFHQKLRFEISLRNLVKNYRQKIEGSPMFNLKIFFYTKNKHNFFNSFWIILPSSILILFLGHSQIYSLKIFTRKNILQKKILTKVFIFEVKTRCVPYKNAYRRLKQLFSRSFIPKQLC